MSERDYAEGVVDGIADRDPEFERLALGANRLNDYERGYIDSGQLEKLHAFADETDRARLLATLVHLRISRGITQAQVAKRMGITQSTVSAFEHGFQEGREYSIGTIQRYARAIDVDLRLSIEPKTPEDPV